MYDDVRWFAAKLLGELQNRNSSIGAVNVTHTCADPVLALSAVINGYRMAKAHQLGNNMRADELRAPDDEYPLRHEILPV
jgi:hypothetical protein